MTRFEGVLQMVKIGIGGNNGKIYKPKAMYTLNKEEIRNVCAWVKQLRLPNGFVSNISRCVNEIDCKFYGMKSHDCHIFLQRLLPIVLRDMVPHSIWDAITEMSYFFRDLCAIEIPVDHMETLQGKICEIICKLEKIFPPGFFNCMEHLPIHLLYKAKVGGPVQYRWMYPFERFLQHLKKKVKNRASVEGSICEAYIIKEKSSFCSLYFEPVVRTRLNKVPHNDDEGEVDSLGHLSIFTHLGRAFGPLDKSQFLDEDEFYAAELYVLMNCEEMLPYIKIFNDIVKGDVVHISEDDLEKAAKCKDEIDPRLLEISYGPRCMIRCYKGYFVNGFKFHTLDYGQNRKTMNSGVCIKGSFYNDYERDFYSILVDIIELEYFGMGNRVVLFKCHWFDTEKARSRFHIHSGGDRENDTDLSEEVYQEAVSTSITGTPSEELGDFTVLANDDYEEVNLLIADEEDDMEGDENEDEDQIEDDDFETFNDDNDNNEEHEFAYFGSD
ncbi:PREDICTED: uncharacterized protein LOC108661945 [Theobroma cacao]|uniref:Uncharacterized protein LOC108661945 n=1 Tax=Theobroma cacao TaxID=3641 RepID=A0AB32WCI6_THECC|nr:PREDICTED: uncharacterized protein LOC108661945 [Theobroma cacao]